MVLTKTPEQLKNMVEDYIKTTTLKYEDRTKKSQKLDPGIQWQFVIAKFLTITKMSHRDDRIILNYGLKFSPEHQNASKNLSNEEWTDFVHDMNQFILLQGLTYQYDSKEKEINTIIISGWIDVEELNRPNLFKVWDAVNSTGTHINHKIRSKLNQTFKPTDVSDTSSIDIYK